MTRSAFGFETTVAEGEGGSDEGREAEPADEAEPVHEGETMQERARDRFARGLEHVRHERFQEALREFLAAQELAPHPAVLFNIARVYEALYQLEDAEKYYTTYLATVGDVPAKRYAQVEKALGRLREALSSYDKSSTRVPLPTRNVAVNVSCPYPDFLITASETVLATSPLDGALTIPEDAKEVSFVRRGYRSERHPIPAPNEDSKIVCRPAREGTLPEGESGFLRLNIVPDSANVLINGAAPESRESYRLPRGRHLVEIGARDHIGQRLTIEVDDPVVERQVRLAPVPVQDIPVKDSTVPKFVGATLAGVGTLLAGTTIGLFVWNDQRHKEWERERDEIREESSVSSGLSERQADSNAKLHSIQTVDTVTWTTGIAAGTFIAAGAFIYFFKWTRQSEVALAPARVSFTSHW